MVLDADLGSPHQFQRLNKVFIQRSLSNKTEKKPE